MTTTALLIAGLIILCLCFMVWMLCCRFDRLEKRHEGLLAHYNKDLLTCVNELQDKVYELERWRDEDAERRLWVIDKP